MPMEAPPSKTNDSRRRRGRIVLSVVVCMLALLFAAVGVTSLPAVCAICHKSQSVATDKTAHASTGCYDCHVESGVWGFPAQKNAEFFRMYPKAVFSDGLQGPASTLGRSACLGCHEDVLKRVVSGDGLSIRHSVCAPGATCDGCHSTVAHPKNVRWIMNPSMEACVACHRARGASLVCETCHTSEPEERRSIRGAWQHTHGSTWRRTHGMGDQSQCGICHASDFCGRCHGAPVPHPVDFGATHGTYALRDRDKCQVCHKSEKDFCFECHKTPMPHPASFLKGHMTVAKSLSDPACIRCHVDTDCGTCHTYHTHPGGGQGVPVPWSAQSESVRP